MIALRARRKLRDTGPVNQRAPPRNAALRALRSGRSQRVPAGCPLVGSTTPRMVSEQRQTWRACYRLGGRDAAHRQFLECLTADAELSRAGSRPGGPARRMSRGKQAGLTLCDPAFPTGPQGRSKCTHSTVGASNSRSRVAGTNSVPRPAPVLPTPRRLEAGGSAATWALTGRLTSFGPNARGPT